MACVVIHPPGVTLRREVPYVGAPEIKARRLVLAVRYHSEIGNPGYNDEWMRENRYLEPAVRLTAGECLRPKTRGTELQSASPADSAQDALRKMDELDISQLPVLENERFLGAVTEDRLVALVLHGQDLSERVVREVMERPFSIVDPDTTIDEITGLLSGETAILVRMPDGTFEILTKADVVHAIAGRAQAEP